MLLLQLLSCERAAPRRMTLTRTADLRIVVHDTLAAVDDVTKATEAAGGYVSSSMIWRDGEELHAKVTLRVPPDKLTSTLSSFRGMATRVESETITARPPSAVSSRKHERACGVL
jgi:microcompartment protein CcmL/EutN